MTTAAPIRSLDQVQRYVVPAIASLLDRLDGRTRRVAGYQLGLWDADGRPTSDRGTGIRPALALLSARAADGAVEVGVPAAVAVELAYHFSLLHDGVAGTDTERPHRPAAWAVFGQPTAVLAGDALLTLAEEVVASAPGGGVAAARLRSDIRRLIAGQAAELAFTRQDEVDLTECLQMVADKTAALMSCACSLGAMLCGGAPARVAGLSRFGNRLGMACQLVDDLLGIWGDHRRTGKPVHADLRARRKTLPVVWAMGSGTPAGRRVVELYRNPELNDEQAALAASLIEQTGARQWTRERAEQELAAALSELDQLDLPDELATELTALAALRVDLDPLPRS